MNLVLLQYIDRSGSSYLANLLSRFPKIFVLPEAGYLGGELLQKPEVTITTLPNLLEKLHADSDSHFQLKNWPVKALLNHNLSSFSCIDFFYKLIEKYCELYHVKQSVVVFKYQFTAGSYHALHTFHHHKFQLKHLFLFRDPRAICNSQIKTYKQYPTIPFSKNPWILIQKWKHFYLEAIANKQKSDLHIIWYEDVIYKEQNVLNDLLKFLEITGTYSENRNQYFDVLSAVEKELHAPIMEKPRPYRIHAWKEELNSILIRLIEYYILLPGIIFNYTLSRKNQKFSLYYLLMLLYSAYYRIRVFIRLDRG